MELFDDDFVLYASERRVLATAPLPSSPSGEDMELHSLKSSAVGWPDPVRGFRVMALQDNVVIAVKPFFTHPLF